MRDNRHTVRVVSSLAGLALAVPSVLGFGGGNSIGINFAADEPDGANTAVVAADETAGITEAAQKNWNNVTGVTGSQADLVMDDQGSSVSTTASVEWADVPNTWSSTGRGEENNGFPDGPDRRLMTGYLDTNNDSTTTVTISGIPAELTGPGYNVVVYSLGGVAGRGGGFWVEDESGNALSEVRLGTSPTNPTEYLEDPGVDHADEGNYMVFSGLSASTLVIKGSTESDYGSGGTERAGINAVQLFEISAESAPVFRNPTGNGARFSVVIDDLGNAVVDESTVVVKLDGTEVAADVSKAGSRTTATYSVLESEGRVLASGSTHDVEVSLSTTEAKDYSTTGPFTVAPYATLAPGDQVTPDTSLDGYTIGMYQTTEARGTTIAEAEQQLAGQIGNNIINSYLVWNDPFTFGVPDTSGGDQTVPSVFELEGVINHGQNPAGDGDQGNFPDDKNFPGVDPDGNTDNIVGEIITYAELPAGWLTLGFNSDDGFETSGGVSDDVFLKKWMGEYNGGRGAADTLFNVHVEEAGVYCLRTLWFEGGGGANFEWFIVLDDGTKVLLNDTANGGPTLYRATTTVMTDPAINSVSPGIGATGIYPTTGLAVVIEEKGDAVQQGSIQLTVGGAEVATTATKDGDLWTVTYDLPAGQLWASGQVVQAGISFTTSGGASRSETWTFEVTPYRGPMLDNVEELPVLLMGNATQTGDAGGRSGTPGDYAFDVGVADGSGLVPDISLLNASTADDTLSVAFWQKLRAVGNSSAFWMYSPSSSGNSRGFQAHLPWSDNNVVFDTSGCCAEGAQRTILNIDQFPNYSGDAAWWEDWHHFAFVKNGSDKLIYIDGLVFHAGPGDPLMTDFTDMVMGAEGVTANRMNGLLDDFAVFDGGLTAQQVSSLAGGADPSSVSGLLLHWDFNTPLPPDEEPEISSIVLNGDGSITVEWVGGGILEVAPEVTGPWTEVTGATSPHTFTPTEAILFGRIKQ